MSKSKIPWQIPRHYVFLILLVGVALPLIFPLGFKSEVSDLTKQVYQLVDESPEGSNVIISFDYDPATITELQPMAKALIEHAWRRNQKVLALALWPQGVQMADQAFADIKEKYPDKKYGIDYVNLGFKSGGMVTIQAMGRSFKDVFPTDLKGTKYDELPILKHIQNYKQIAYVVSLSAGDPGLKQYVMAAHDMFRVKVTGGTTAVSTPGFLPYINDQHQMIGLLGGLKGAAEYEAMINVKGTATSGMDAQSVAHLLIILFILLGNIRAYKIRKLKI